MNTYTHTHTHTKLCVTAKLKLLIGVARIWLLLYTGRHYSF